MRLLSLDFDPVYGGDTTRASFASDISVFDYDVVIWDPEASCNSYTSYAETYRGCPCLSDDASVRIQADASRRRGEFKEFVEAGRSLVVIARPPQTCYVATGEKTYSGTGRNRATTRMVNLFDLLSAVPVADPRLRIGRGDRVEVVGDGPIQTFLRAHKDLLSYSAIIEEPPGLVLARVTGTDRAVSSLLVRKSGGQLLLLPSLLLESEAEENEDEDAEDSDGWIPEAPAVQEALLSALSESNGGREISRPLWAERYETAEQKKLRVEAVKQQTRVEDARTKLASTQQKLEAARERDQLFLGSGRALELEVKLVLELLGATVTEPEPGRDDWKATFPERTAVVEVKGVGKSAAEKQAAQLEKWVAGELEKTGVLPKGILVVNTWRDAPLEKRTRQNFPDQMLPYCEGRDHCLVTGLQLFLIRHEVERDANKAACWRGRLLGTKGRLVDVPDWQTVVKETKTSE
jgi:hypothetical protein